MGRAKSRLNNAIDIEISKSFEASGSADAVGIYDRLRLDHDDMVQAELAEDARRGLMRRIEQRLKQFVTQDDDEEQVSLPGLSRDLMMRIDETITVPRDDGSCSYLYIRHANTTVGDVVSHIEMLRGKEESLNAKIAAWHEVIQRCGSVAHEMPLVEALAAASPPPAPGSAKRRPDERRPSTH